VASNPLKQLQPDYLCMLAQACCEWSRFQQGFDAVNEALTLAAASEDRYCEPESYRLIGELLLKQNVSHLEEAEVSFQRAIEIARKQSAKSWELRSAMSLVRLPATQGRHTEARTTLSDIYSWFTEGFDTADLVEAKALLTELS
jgi:predicted ATPase